MLWETQYLGKVAKNIGYIVGNELCCSAGVFPVKVRAHHSTPASTTLVEGGGADQLQAGSPCLYKCRQGVAPAYLADELWQSADTEARRRLRSASSSSTIVRRTQLSIVSNRSFPVAAPRVWNSLPQHVTSEPSLAFFHSHLKIHLFRHCFP